MWIFKILMIATIKVVILDINIYRLLSFDGHSNPLHTDEETEAWRSGVNCAKAYNHSSEVGFYPRSPVTVASDENL